MAAFDRESVHSSSSDSLSIERTRLVKALAVLPKLRDIWLGVLEIDEINPDDDFFEIGGDSLSAVMILARINQQFQVRVSENELFTARTLSGVAQIISAALGSTTEVQRVPITREPQTEYPASRGQSRLWLLHESIARPEVYNVPFLLMWQGAFDLTALQAAFQHLETRHEVLRTTLIERQGRLLQQVNQLSPLELTLTDLRDIPATNRRQTVIDQATQDAKKPFDLAKPRLYRIQLFRTGTDEYYWYLNFHHTIIDGWSFGVFFKELETAYEAFARQQSPATTELAIQYGDYARHQRDFLTTEKAEEHLAFWRQQLAQPIATLDLPTAKPRPAKSNHLGGYHQFTIPRKTIAAIDGLAREESVTRFMIGLAVWNVVLSRLTKQTDIVVGTPVAGRTLSETEPLLGMFTNMLALRTNLDANPTFRDILDRVRQVRLNSFIHQELPIDYLVEKLNPPRDPSRNPFFQTAFYYQNVNILPERFSRAKITNVPIHSGTSMFDIRFVLEDGPYNSLWGWLEYDSDLFSHADAKKLIDQFFYVLEQAASDPAIRLHDMSVLTPTDRQQILFDWNNTAGDYPDQERLPDAFLRQVQQQPDAVALVSTKESITYRQLGQQVERVAAELLALQLQPGELVGVCLNRTPAMVVAVLAIVRAGGAYVPLDPNYPADRLQFMLEDTEAKIVLTETSLVKAMPFGDRRLLLMDRLPSSAIAPNNPPIPSTPDHVAYVIYTSGSTGQPKGVVVRHRAAINTIDWVNQTLHVRPSDRLLFVTSLSFDLSVYDIFGLLGAGGSLYVTNELELREPQRLAELLHSGQITMWDSAPAALQQVVPFFRAGEPSHSLRLVMLSGDWIPVTLPDQVRRVFTNAKMISLGGATEAAIWSNWFPIEEVDPTWASIPYGKPIRNAVYHILDEQLHPVPVGVPGELHIGGVCLADGYLNRTELSAQRFIADPFRPGERLYKTGDLAKYWPDGTIEFLGRIDHQVKVRGYRVELGEIEAALCQHPAVREAIVKPFRDSGGVVTLTAFIVYRERVSVQDLTAHLKQRMPEYMVPSSFVSLDAIPLTSNGKVDRASLKQPAVNAANRSVTGKKEPPKNDLEATIAEAFSEVLGVGAVGRDDNFFDLGGHSLKAAELVARVQHYLGFNLKLAALLAAPTVRELAIMIQQKLELGQGCVVPLNEEGPYPPLFMIAGAGGHVFAFQRFSKLLGGEFPAYGMKAVGVDGTEPPLERIEEIATRYLDEIVQYRPKGPYIISGYSVGGLVAYELATQMVARGLEVAKVIVFDTYAPGYPRKRAWPIRMMIHGKNFLFGSGFRSKWNYLRQRFINLRHRLLSMSGYGHLDMPEYPGITGLSAEIIKRVWAGLDRAKNRYWPKNKLNVPFVIAKSDQQMVWAATTHDDPNFGWGDWVTGPIDTFSVPAGHMEFFDDRNVSFLVSDMRAAICQTMPHLEYVSSSTNETPEAEPAITSSTNL